MRTETKEAVESLTVSLEGELDRAIYGEKLRQIRQVFAESPRDLDIDCARLVRISPMAVAALVRLREFIETEGHVMRLVNVSSDVAGVFQRGGLDLASVAKAAPVASRLQGAAPPPAANVGIAAPVRAPEAHAPAVSAGGANLAGELDRLKEELARMESDLATARDEAHAAAREREKAQELYLELRARVESLRDENKKLAEELSSRTPEAVLAPLANVQSRIREALKKAESHTVAFTEACREVEEALSGIGISAEAAVRGGEQPFTQEFLVAMVGLDPTIRDLARKLHGGMSAAEEKLSCYVKLFGDLGDKGDKDTKA